MSILVIEAVRAELGDAFELQQMRPQPVKGIDEPVATWAVIGPAATQTIQCQALPATPSAP